MSITNITPLWYAVHVMPRWEKKVNEALLGAGIEVYAPTQKKLRQWSDRKKWVEEPVIRSYVFVKINQKEYYTVLNTNGVLRFISFEGKPAPVREEHITILRNLIEQNIEVEITNENFEPGDKVEIIRGPLKGLKGELIRHNSSKKVLIRLENMYESFLITISPSLLIINNN